MELDGSDLILVRVAQDRWDLYSGSELLSSVDSRATNITLEGQESVLPRVAKMTLIIFEGGLE